MSIFPQNGLEIISQGLEIIRSGLETIRLFGTYLFLLMNGMRSVGQINKIAVSYQLQLSKCKKYIM